MTPTNNDEQRAPGHRGAGRNSLVALGSAAVLAVYAAGFVKTSAAAARFDAEDAGRRKPAPVEPGPEIGGVVARPVAVDSAPAVTPPQPKSVKSAPKLDTATTVVAPAHADTAASVPPAAVPPAAVVAVPVASADPAAAATTQPPRLKDGAYLGWGSSRHGDIQALVEVKDGEILSASVAQCLTQYSCSRIDMLPGQVVTRQSAEVDYVSGATQSSNAFYYAVVNALKQAK